MMFDRLHAIEQAPCRFDATMAYDGRDTIDAYAIAGFRAEVDKHNKEK